MLNLSKDQFKSKYTRLLIRNKHSLQKKQAQKSMFSLQNENIHSNNKEIQQENKLLKQYDICGDKLFKDKFLADKNKQLSQLGVISATNSQFKNQQDKAHHYEDLNQSNYQTKNKFNETIYQNQDKRLTYFSQLNSIQRNTFNRQRRVMNDFKERQKSWQKIQTHLKYRLPKSETVTFTSVNKLYVHQNPQKIEIINDMIPEYWRKSLRNNDKVLKGHLKGHTFRHQMAQEMLQTLKGTKAIESSIPRIDAQRTQKQFFTPGKISIKSKKIQKQQGSQTMRQFHKSLYQTLGNTISSRKVQKSMSKTKRNQQFSQTNRSLIKIHNQNEDQQFLSSNEKKLFKFCHNLQNLDKFNNELYLRQYQKKKIWQNQARLNLN